MRVDEYDEFSNYILGMASMRRIDLSPMQVEIWFETLREFDIDSIKSAMLRHMKDPDEGKWMPQPSDIIRIMQGGGTMNLAELAWNQAFKAVEIVGSWVDVLFDDPIVHAVIDGMGGWAKFCQGTYKDFDYKRQQFIRSYNAYKQREDFDYPAVLIGITHTENLLRGYKPQPPVVVGDREKAALVYQKGSAGQSLAISHKPIGKALLRLVG